MAVSSYAYGMQRPLPLEPASQTVHLRPWLSLYGVHLKPKKAEEPVELVRIQSDTYVHRNVARMSHATKPCYVWLACSTWQRPACANMLHVCSAARVALATRRVYSAAPRRSSWLPSRRSCQTRCCCMCLPG